MQLLIAGCESRTARREKYSRTILLVEQSWLRCGCSGLGFAAGYSDYTEHGQFSERGARNKDTVGRGVQVGRSNLNAVVEHGKQVIRYDTLDCFAVAVPKTHPQPIQLGTAKEGLALWFEVIGKLANKINRTHPPKRNLLVLPLLGKQVDRIGLAQA